MRENQRPDRPEPELGVQRGLTDDIWFLITKSWEKDPQLRPTFKQLSQLLPEGVESAIDDLQGEAVCPGRALEKQRVLWRDV